MYIYIYIYIYKILRRGLGGADQRLPARRRWASGRPRRLRFTTIGITTITIIIII